MKSVSLKFLAFDLVISGCLHHLTFTEATFFLAVCFHPLIWAAFCWESTAFGVVFANSWNETESWNSHEFNPDSCCEVTQSLSIVILLMLKDPSLNVHHVDAQKSNSSVCACFVAKKNDKTASVQKICNLRSTSAKIHPPCFDVVDPSSSQTYDT